MSKSVDDGTRLFGRSRTIQTLLLKVSRVAVTRVGVLIVGESGAGKDIVARLLHDMAHAAAGRSFRQLRRDSSRHCGIAPVRSRERQFHRRRCPAHRHVRGRAAARCFSTRSPKCRPSCKSSCCARSSRTRSCGSAATNRSRSTCGSSPPPITTRSRPCAAGGCARTCSTGSRRSLHVPALRQREDDVDDIALQIVERLNARHRTRKRLSIQAMKALRAYTWPGNVRELRNTLERAFILADEQIELQLPRRAAARRMSSQRDHAAYRHDARAHAAALHRCVAAAFQRRQAAHRESARHQPEDAVQPARAPART